MSSLFVIVFFKKIAYSSCLHIISGLKVRQLCVSDDLVWAISEDGNLMCRVGITTEHIQGECWKQVPSRSLTQLAGL